MAYKQTKWNGFVNFYLSKEQEQEAKKLIKDYEQVYDLLAQSIIAGMQFKLSYDILIGAYRCICFGAIGSPNEGWGVSTLSGTMRGAIGGTMYKITKLSPDGVWPKDNDKSYIEF